jgi:hypothetical protein
MAESTVTQKVVINLLLVALGYLIKRAGLVSRDDGRVLNRIVLYVTLPAMNLLVISRAELSWTLLILPVLFLATAVVIRWAGRAPARWLGLSRQDTGTFVVSLCGVMGSLAYPFAEAAFGEPGVRTVAVSDLGNAIGIFGVAYYVSFFYSGRGQFSVGQVLKKVAVFFPLHAFLVALFFNLLRVQFTGVVGGFISTLASLNTPLLLLALGIYLEIDISWQESRVLLTQLAYKYGTGLIVALFCLWALPVSGPTRAVAFVFPLMSTSFSTLLYSVEQDLNPRLAAMLISLTMLISLGVASVVAIWFHGAF